MLKNQSNGVLPRIEKLESGKVSKNGDTVDGILYANRFFVKDGDMKGGMYYGSDNRIILNNTKGGAVSLFDDGTTKITAKNLNTSSKEAISAVNELNSKKADLTGSTFTGLVAVKKDTDGEAMVALNSAYGNGDIYSGGSAKGVGFRNRTSGVSIFLSDSGETKIAAKNLNTISKEVVSAINELNSGKENKIDKKTGFNLEKTSDYKAADADKVFTQAGANSLYKEVSKKATENEFGLMKVGTGLVLNNEEKVSVDIVNDTSTGGIEKVISAECMKNVFSNGMTFKGTVDSGLINDRNLKTGVYDVQSYELIPDCSTFYSILNWGIYTQCRVQLASPYQFGQESNLFFRTSSPSGWKGGWCKIWHDKNFNPTEYVKFINSKNKEIKIGTTVFGADGEGTGNQRLYIHFTDSGTINSFYKDGRLELRAKNLKTISKGVVEGINELNDRFENPKILYTNSSGNPISSFVATGLSNYRVISVKYRVAANRSFSMLNGPDITQMLIYLDEENKYFHLWNDNSRVRYEIQGDKIVREYTDGSSAGYICITKIYGIIKK